MSTTNTKQQMSETHLLGLLLALVGGFLDAYTYICRGHVFANAQTGNLVLLGVYLTNGDWSKAFHYFMPVLAFVLGILICEMIQSEMEAKLSLAPGCCFSGIYDFSHFRIFTSWPFQCGGKYYGFLCMRPPGRGFSQNEREYLCHHHVYW